MIQADTLKPGWKLVKFGDVVRLSKERATKSEIESIERYVGLEHIDPEDLRIRRWGLVAEGITFTSKFKPGQVLFGKRRAYQRKVAVADFEGVCSGDIYVFESANQKVLLPELLPFICQTDQFFEYAVGTSAGSLSPRTNWTSLAKFEFALPVLEKQKNICKLLTAVEESKDTLFSAIKDSKVLWRSLSFKEFNHKIGEEILDKHYTIVSGQVDPQDPSFGNLPLIAPNHIESETGKLLKLELVKEQGAISGKYLFDSGTILYSKIRPNLVKATIAPCQGLCSADMYAIVPKSSIRKEYLLEIFLSDKFTQFAISGSMRTGMPKLNRAHLALYKTKIPPLKEQDSYLEIIKSIRLAENSILSRINFNKKLKQSIIQEMWK